MIKFISEETSIYSRDRVENKITFEIQEGLDLSEMVEKFTFFLKAITYPVPENSRLEWFDEEKEVILDLEEYDRLRKLDISETDEIIEV